MDGQCHNNIPLPLAGDKNYYDRPSAKMTSRGFNWLLICLKRGGGGGVMVIASMYPASRIVVIPINCEYTSILDNMLLLRTLRYDFCKCSGASLYVYKPYFR